ncbi:hypothetical protein BT96DRAFT_1004959 [Gymnopus androsaceus JB14]|uniref:Uncharacterized protein n=1 Tax=Gymnopus androsaceus JB14 TaxID=1447944 RepID=A0A6A4GQW5_9AGAR|nr:hypothetical protein BT96DRAFT_1004959 [Gymnopus androsaceus JB14]
MSYTPLYAPQKAFKGATASQNGPSLSRLISLHKGYEPNPDTITPPSSPTNKVTREGFRLYSDSGSSFSFNPTLLLYNLKGYTGSPFMDFTPVIPSYVNSTPSNVPYFSAKDLSIPNKYLLPPPVTRNDLLFPITVPGGMRSQFAVPFYYLNPQITKPPYDPFAIVPSFNVPISRSLMGRSIGGSINTMFLAEENGHILDIFLRQLAGQPRGIYLSLHHQTSTRGTPSLHRTKGPGLRGSHFSKQSGSPDTLPTDSKQEVIVAGQSKLRPLYSNNGCNFSLYVPIHNFSPTYVKTWRWKDSNGKKHKFSSSVCSDTLELQWNMPSAARTFSFLGPVHDSHGHKCRVSANIHEYICIRHLNVEFHDRRRNNWESYPEGHGSTFVDRSVRDSYSHFDLSFHFVYAITDHFLLGDELVSLEFYVHVWRSDPDLTYTKIERGVIAKVAPERYRPHRGCISRNAFTTMLKCFATFKDLYGQNETVFN